jgi:hypothetical protein
MTTEDPRITSLRKRLHNPPYVTKLAEEISVLFAAYDNLKLSQPPCDGGCNINDGPQEDCSAHGRPVSYVWGLVDEKQRQINAVERVLDEECIADNVHGDLWIDAETLRAAIAAKVKE